MTRSEWLAEMGLPQLDGDSDEAVHELWHDFYFHAFDALRDDRNVFIGQFGYLGESGIFYTAISRYCQDQGIVGAAAQKFTTFIHAIDAENRLILAEEREREQSKQGSPNA
jgi:hypothetical protein